MKILEKITLIIYSYVILIISVLACLLVFGWVDIDLSLIHIYLYENE